MVSSTVEDYLKAFLRLEDMNEKASTSTVARHLSVADASVTDMLRKLQKNGLLEYKPYYGATLTTEGRKLALRILRRHRLIELFLHKVMGYGWEQVHDEAEKLEHVVSDLFVERIDAYLGYPDKDPHGEVIPDAKGFRNEELDICLLRVEPGEYVVRKVTNDQPRVSGLPSEAIPYPGSLVSVAGESPIPRPIETGALRTQGTSVPWSGGGEKHPCVAGRATRCKTQCAFQASWANHRFSWRSCSANSRKTFQPQTKAFARVNQEAAMSQSGEKDRAAVQPRGFHLPQGSPSLPEVYQTIEVPQSLGFWRKMLAFAGPGYMVAVGYMDPGNWATDLAGGARFNYTLLSVIMISNLMAILLQALAVKLGVVTGRDLAQACRDYYSRPVSMVLWVLCEIAIAACDLAEVIGSAIALNLLFGLPLAWGVCLTALDVLAVLYLQQKGFRYIEAFVIALIGIIGTCFAIEIILSRPSLSGVLAGFVPRAEILRNPEMLYIAIGILGATVMPHNLYLHSSIVQTRKYGSSPKELKEAIRFATLDSTVALMFALFINAAILIMAAATFHHSGNQNVAEIGDAYKLLSPLLGTTMASILFAVALLCSGQNSTLTGTLAGQIVMEGFLNIRLRPWLRRLITRLIAIVPAVVCVILYGESGTAKLLILSQVVLSLQLSFAVFPLVLFTSDRRKMHEFVNPLWLKSVAWIIAVVIGALNAWLLIQTVRGWMA